LRFTTGFSRARLGLDVGAMQGFWGVGAQFAKLGSTPNLP